MRRSIVTLAFCVLPLLSCADAPAPDAADSSGSGGSTQAAGATNGSAGSAGTTAGVTTGSGGTAAGSGGTAGALSTAGGNATSGGSNIGGSNVGGASAGGSSAGGSGGASVTCPAVTAPSTPAPTLSVQLSNQYRPVTHAASGSLYGLASDGKPTDAQIAPTKPFMFTQMAPNGQQLPNGATAPTGDSLKVAAAAARAGAKITIRMPDIYPNFPYQWLSSADWLGKVDAMVTAALSSNAKNLYAYEIWNEPNWTWDNTAGTFNDNWRSTYQRIKAKDTATKIMGPSISIWDANFMRNFLSYCKTNNCLPDIVSWHELGDVNGVARPRYIATSVAAYRAMEVSLGISKRPISINEYGIVPEEGVPGDMIRYVAQFERQGVESACIAFWHQAGQLSDLITNKGSANGGWWLYKFYGDMSGIMAMTTPTTTGDAALGMDGIASIDATAKNVQLVFGGADGDNAISVQGFGSAPFFGCTAHVKAESAPWNGVNAAVTAATTLSEADYPISGGQIVVSVPGMKATSGYRLTITPK